MADLNDLQQTIDDLNERINALKGDVAGHAFHGNQWTGGGEVASAMAAADHKEKAREHSKRAYEHLATREDIIGRVADSPKPNHETMSADLRRAADENDKYLAHLAAYHAHEDASVAPPDKLAEAVRRAEEASNRARFGTDKDVGSENVATRSGSYRDYGLGAEAPVATPNK